MQVWDWKIYSKYDLLSITISVLIYAPTRRKVVHHVKNNTVHTPTQKTELIKLRTRLHCEMARFRAIQKVFMPAALPMLPTANDNVTLPYAYAK